MRSPRTGTCDGRRDDARDPGDRPSGPVLQVQDLRRFFQTPTLPFVGRDTTVRAVDGVSFDVAAGEAFGLVGESGSGKTTIGRLIVRLLDPSGGRVLFDGGDVARLRGADLLAYRRRVQMVFQNPYASLNPRRRVRDIIGDAYAIHGIARGRDADERMGALLENVGLRASMLERFPHQFSSGQRQRLGIARALSVDPTLVVADEPVSALDVSVQAQVLNLLRGLQTRLGLAIVFISHDLRAVSFLCERIGVSLPGPDDGDRAARRPCRRPPSHPYTRALFGSIPSLEPGRGVTRELIRGEDRRPGAGVGRMRLRAPLPAAVVARQPVDLCHDPPDTQRCRLGPRRGLPFRGPGRRSDRGSEFRKRCRMIRLTGSGATRGAVGRERAGRCTPDDGRGAHRAACRLPGARPVRVAAERWGQPGPAAGPRRPRRPARRGVSTRPAAHRLPGRGVPATGRVPGADRAVPRAEPSEIAVVRGVSEAFQHVIRGIHWQPAMSS